MGPHSKNPRNANLPRAVALHDFAPAGANIGWRPLLLLAGIAFAVVLPILFLGNPSGHDFEFHLSSWIEVAGQWRHGIAYPRWASGSYGGFGEPRFIFYPPLSWILGAALGTFLPWKAVPGAFAWISLMLAGFATYRLVRESQPPQVALWAAALYATNPYNIINIYHRSAFAELLASALFPLLLLFALRLTRPATDPSATQEPGEHTRNIAGLSLVVAAIWLTNAPAAVVGSYSLALLLTIAALRNRSFRPLLRGALAGALGLAVAGIYIVPALYEQRWVHIADAFSSPLRPEDNFLFAASSPFTWPSRNPQSGDEFNFLISWVEMAELALATWVVAASRPWWRRPVSGFAGSEFRTEARHAPGLPLVTAIFFLGATAGLLLLRPSLPIWRILPYLRNIQFPWRWLFVLNLAVAIGGAAGVGQGRLRHASKFLALAVWLLVNSYLLTGYLLTPPAWEGTDVAQYAAAVSSEAGYEGMSEYLPNDGDIEQLPAGAPLVALANPESPPVKFSFVMEKWQAEEKQFSIESSEAARLSLHLLNYPAWRVEVNGGPGAKESNPDNGQLIISVPAGRSTVRVFFARTPDRTAGGAISLAAIALIAALFAAGRHQPKK